MNSKNMLKKNFTNAIKTQTLDDVSAQEHSLLSGLQVA